MALPVYPGTINYKPDLSSFRVQEAYAPPVWTEFEDGPALGRRSRIGRRARLAYRVMFTSMAEYETFRAFVETTLADGTMRFTMPVWVPVSNSYVTKTVQIDKGVYTADSWASGMSVSFTLLVYNW